MALCPLAGYGLGLGTLEVKSALNEPLDAEIDITAVNESELSDLEISLASRADFDVAGAERLPLLARIEFNIKQRPDGRYYVHLTTEAPINEPFLHMLLRIEWRSGRLLREYTALLDPPSYIAGRPGAVESPRAGLAPESARTAPLPSPGRAESTEPLAAPSAPERPRTVQPPAPVETPPVRRPTGPRELAVSPAEPRARDGARTESGAQPPRWTTVDEYTVRPGDTLWEIAERVRADRGLSLEQVILGIFRNNPDAFHLDNVNYMFAGKVLQMPARGDIQSTTTTVARREFRAQYAAWKEYKSRLAARSRTLTVAESEPPSPEPDEPQAASADAEVDAGVDGESTADSTAEAAAEGTGQPPEELLKIVRTAEPEDAAAADGASESESLDPEAREEEALADRVATLEESLASKELENRELSAKIGQVRSQIRNEQRLIELESETLARQTAEPAAEATAAPAPAPAEEAPRAAEAKPKPADQPAAEKPAAAAPAPKPAAPAPARAPSPEPPPAEWKAFILSLIDDVLASSFLPLIGGVVGLAAGLILMVYLRRRRRSIAEFEESILASGAIATEGVATGDTSGQASTGDTSFLSDFSKSGMGQVHTDEVDPVAEAEVYLAYGRDETAEEILKEAIVKNPERHELKTKLLEIYHQRKDAGAFETLAEELYAALGGGGGEIWRKVEEMGRELNPGNPMFRGGGAGQARVAAPPAPVPRGAPPAAAGMAGSAPRPAAEGTLAMDDALSMDMPGDAASPLEFDLDTSSAPTAPQPPPAGPDAPGDAGLDFDLNTEMPRPDAPAPEARAAPGASLETLDIGSADNLIEFETDGEIAPGQAGPELEAEAAPAPDTADDEIKWEMDMSVEDAAAAETSGGDGEGNGADASWDETATKLDLAKAYIDMGDAEGARNILDEVMSEGNEQQKKQAAELAAQIA